MLSPDPNKPDSKSEPKPKPDSKTEPKPVHVVPLPAPASRNMTLIVGLVALAIIVGGVVVAVIVVTGRKPAEVELVSVQSEKRTDLQPPPGTPEPPPAKIVEPAAPDRSTTRPVTVAKKPPRTPDEELVDKLTRTFAGRRTAVSACFATPSNEKITIRLEIGRDGRVSDARVSPDAVAATPAGACLVKVARETAFGTQPKAVAIHVPITATK
jgi:hypothetical protein